MELVRGAVDPPAASAVVGLKTVCSHAGVAEPTQCENAYYADPIIPRTKWPKFELISVVSAVCVV